MEEEHPAKDLLEMEGSPRDQDDMTRMGKIQELKVLFSYISCNNEVIN